MGRVQAKPYLRGKTALKDKGYLTIRNERKGDSIMTERSSPKTAMPFSRPSAPIGNEEEKHRAERPGLNKFRSETGKRWERTLNTVGPEKKKTLKKASERTSRNWGQVTVSPKKKVGKRRRIRGVYGTVAKLRVREKAGTNWGSIPQK